jgi:hypothetical protein
LDIDLLNIIIEVNAKLQPRGFLRRKFFVRKDLRGLTRFLRQATAALPHRPSESEPQSSDANDVFLLMVKNSFQLQTGSYQRSVLNKSKDL